MGFGDINEPICSTASILFLSSASQEGEESESPTILLLCMMIRRQREGSEKVKIPSLYLTSKPFYHTKKDIVARINSDICEEHRFLYSSEKVHTFDTLNFFLQLMLSLLLNF